MKLTPATIVLLLLGTGAAAQTEPDSVRAERDRGWLTISLIGVGYPYGLAGGSTINFGRKRVLQVGAHGTVQLNIFGQGDYLVAYHLSPGLSRVGSKNRRAITLGPALINGRRREARDVQSEYVTLGLILSAQTMVTFVPELGVGLDAFLLVSPVENAVGLGIIFVVEGNQ